MQADISLILFVVSLGAICWLVWDKIQSRKRDMDKWEEVARTQEEERKTNHELLERERMEAARNHRDSIERRLCMGVDTMDACKKGIQDLRDSIMNMNLKFISCDTFDKYDEKHSQDHRILNKTLDDIKENYVTLFQEVKGLREHVNVSMAGIKNQLAELTNLKMALEQKIKKEE